MAEAAIGAWLYRRWFPRVASHALHGFRGLPCPNIFAGGVNFHGPYEFVSIQSMEKAMQVIVKICELTADYNS